MHPNSAKRRSSSNPVRISSLDKDDKNLTWNDRRRTQTKSKGLSIGETSHIPRPRIRSFSSDRASGRTSCLKISGRTPLHQSTTPIASLATPVGGSTNMLNVPSSTTSSSNRVYGLPIGRSPSGERAKGPKKDTRPLTDKSYQAMLLTKIDDFFCVDQHSTMLNSNGSLRPITLKMFVEVSNYLLKIFEVKQELTISNYIEELPQIAKKLHYPGVMTKSWLKTANAMHSWPSVLGWIGWLVEVHQVQELAFNKFQEVETLPFVGTEQQAQNSKMEFLALLKSYNAWNEEKLDEENEILENYLRDVEIQLGISEEDTTVAQKVLEEETRKLQIMEEESRKNDEEIERLQTMLSSLEAKVSKQSNDIREKKEYIKKITIETDQMNAERKSLEEQIHQMNKQHEELASIVKNQPMSKVEKENIVKKCTEIQNYIHGFDEHLKEYQKELYTLDIKLASVSNNLNKMVLAYNKEIFMFTDNDIGVNFSELKLPEKGLLDPHIMEVLEEKLTLTKTLKESLKKQCNDTISLIRSDTIKLENLQEKIKFLPNEEKLREEKLHIDKMKMEAKNEKAKLIEQIEMRSNEIKEIQDAMPDIQAVELEIEEAKNKLEAVIRRMKFLEQSGERFFDQLYKILGEHRSELHNLLTSPNKTKDNKRK